MLNSMEEMLFLPDPQCAFLPTLNPSVQYFKVELLDKYIPLLGITNTQTHRHTHAHMQTLTIRLCTYTH